MLGSCVSHVTVGAKQAFILDQEADGGQLPEEARVTKTVPQLESEATDQSRQLQKHHMTRQMQTLGLIV